MHKSIFSRILLVLFLILFSLSACSKEEEKVVEDPSIEVDEDVKGVELSIPETYPSDLVPIYPNSHLYSVIESNKSYTIMFYSRIF